jgi:hypothetical protein
MKKFRKSVCLLFQILLGFLPVVVMVASKSMYTIAVAKQEMLGVWSPAGSLLVGRHNHTATLLSDGRVLIIGGIQDYIEDSPGLESVEIYNPGERAWDIVSPLKAGRVFHTANLLENGKVLVIGGRESRLGNGLVSVEFYDPNDDTWNSRADLAKPRYGHSATRLANGQVLVVGGRFGNGSMDVHSSASLYNPSNDSWSATGSLNTPRESHSATLLLDGRVLVVGGYYQNWLNSAEIFDPISGMWSEVTLPYTCHGVAHTATQMPDGRVFVVGGACGSGPSGIQDKTEFFDPSTLTWIPTADLPEVREAHTTTLLKNGKILIVGGDGGDIPRYDSALIYDPTSDRWYSAGSLSEGRRNHAATLLDNGGVLIVGGWGNTNAMLDSTEKYHHKQHHFLPMIMRDEE